MKANFKSILMLVVMVAVVLFAVSAFTGPTEDEDVFTYGDLI